MLTRLSGLPLLGICACAVGILHRLVLTLPRHEASPVELLLALVAVLAGSSGAAILCVGAALFAPCERPQCNRRLL